MAERPNEQPDSVDGSGASPLLSVVRSRPGTVRRLCEMYLFVFRRGHMDNVIRFVQRNRAKTSKQQVQTEVRRMRARGYPLWIRTHGKHGVTYLVDFDG